MAFVVVGHAWQQSVGGRPRPSCARGLLRQAAWRGTLACDDLARRQDAAVRIQRAARLRIVRVRLGRRHRAGTRIQAMVRRRQAQALQGVLAAARGGAHSADRVAQMEWPAEN